LKRYNLEFDKEHSFAVYSDSNSLFSLTHFFDYKTDKTSEWECESNFVWCYSSSASTAIEAMKIHLSSIKEWYTKEINGLEQRVSDTKVYIADIHDEYDSIKDLYKFL